MSVVFESKIKVDFETNSWYIELKDTIEDKIINCANLEEYEKAIEELGADYGGNIDEVNWSSDINVPPHFLDEVRMEMARYKEEHMKEDTK